MGFFELYKAVQNEFFRVQVPFAAPKKNLVKAHKQGICRVFFFADFPFWCLFGVYSCKKRKKRNKKRRAFL